MFRAVTLLEQRELAVQLGDLLVEFRHLGLRRNAGQAQQRLGVARVRGGGLQIVVQLGNLVSRSPMFLENR